MYMYIRWYFFITIFSSLGVDILSDIILNPLLGKQEIERERGVILREMEVWLDPLDVFFFSLSLLILAQV